MSRANSGEIGLKVGDEISVSSWIRVTQAHINTFADVTGDRQFIHIDPTQAKDTPFGNTIAHGLLTLSLLSQMASQTKLLPDARKMAMNYGLEKVRFLSPVLSGKRVRGRFTLAKMREKTPGQWQLLYHIVVEIEGEDKPALVADWIILLFT